MTLQANDLREMIREEIRPLVERVAAQERLNMELQDIVLGNERTRRVGVMDQLFQLKREFNESLALLKKELVEDFSNLKQQMDAAALQRTAVENQLIGAKKVLTVLAVLVPGSALAILAKLFGLL